MITNSIQIDREIVRRGFLFEFIKKAWHVIQSKPFVPNWHHEEISAHLQALYQCQIKNLIINVPPGTTKSTITNILWPAFIWAIEPDIKWLFGSFDASLVGTRDGSALIRLMQSDWYRARFGDLLKESKPAASNFETKQGGFRFATSPGGKGFGRHPNITVIDDPIKQMDLSGSRLDEKAAIRKANDWLADTISTRKADPETHRMLIVMQRVHFDDPCGIAERQGGYEILKLPMRFEESRRCITSIGGDRRQKEGELLFPERFPSKEIDRLEIQMTPSAFAAQMQQRPSVEGGGIFKRSTWRFWSRTGKCAPCLCEQCYLIKVSNPYAKIEHQTEIVCEKLPLAGSKIFSWDMTFKDLSTSDYACGGYWINELDRFFLVDIINEKLAFADALLTILRLDRDYPAEELVIEDKANGPAIVSEIRRLRALRSSVKEFNPRGSKTERASAISPYQRGQFIYLPHPDENPKTWEIISQCEQFPKGLYDDIVDMMSQAILYFLGDSNELLRRAMQNVR